MESETGEQASVIIHSGEARGLHQGIEPLGPLFSVFSPLSDSLSPPWVFAPPLGDLPSFLWAFLLYPLL